MDNPFVSGGHRRNTFFTSLWFSVQCSVHDPDVVSLNSGQLELRAQHSSRCLSQIWTKKEYSNPHQNLQSTKEFQQQKRSIQIHITTYKVVKSFSIRQQSNHLMKPPKLQVWAANDLKLTEGDASRPPDFSINKGKYHSLQQIYKWSAVGCTLYQECCSHLCKTCLSYQITPILMERRRFRTLCIPSIASTQITAQLMTMQDPLPMQFEHSH